MKNTILSIVIILPCVFFGQLTFNNPGLEGDPGQGITPNPWQNCMPFGFPVDQYGDYATPDTHPNLPAVYYIVLPPSEGDSYIGFGHITPYNDIPGLSEFQEGFSQELSSPMIANNCPYVFTIDLANGLTPDPWNTTGIQTTIGEVKVFGGFDVCSEEELLWESGPITNEDWETYTIEFTPSNNYTHILFECFKYDPNAACGYVLADNITPIRNSPPISNAGENQELCDDLTNLNANNPDINETGLWTLIAGSGVFNDPTDPNTLITGLSEGENILQWSLSSDICGSFSDQISINYIVSNITVNAGQNMQICQNNTYLSGNMPGEIESGYWSIISGSGTFENINNPTTLIENLSIGDNIIEWNISDPCQSMNSQVTITFDTINVGIVNISNYTEYQISCPGENDGWIDIFTIGGYPPYTYNWLGPNDFTSNSEDISNLPYGNYECIVTDSLMCEKILYVILEEPPLIELEILNIEDLDCLNNGHIEYSVNGGAGILIGEIITAWNDTISFEWEENGLYYASYEDFNLWNGLVQLTTTDENECKSDTLEINVQSWEDPIAQFNVSTYNAMTLELIEFNDNSYAEADIESWTWDFGDGYIENSQTPQTNHFYEDEGQYTICLTIEDINGCISETCQIINIYTNTNIYIPNIFTVNNDGINDSFKPVIQGIKKESYSLLIYNRWGKMLFSTNNPKKGWNGMYNEKIVKQDIYSYKINYITNSGNHKEHIGKVTLVK